MLKSDPSSLAHQRSEPSSKVRSPKSRKKPAKSRINIAFDRTNITKMIQQIREELEFYRGRTAELEAKLEKLTKIASEEPLLAQESENIAKSLNKDEAKVERGTQASEELPSREALSRLNYQKEQWKKDLDSELNNLLSIKKLLEASPPSEPEKKALPVHVLAANTTKKILVIDDDPTTINIITHFLEKEKCAVISSCSGVDGLKKAFKENPDLIVLDILMPDLNGFQFLSILRKDEDSSRIPVVIISSLAEEADVLRGLNIGAADYITKPFSPQVLMTKIKKHLNSQP